MIFSTRSEYGVMILSYLAANQSQGPISLTDIADSLGLSLKMGYMEQIVPALRNQGFIESVRGVKGGYILSKNPADIRMGAVIRALEARKDGTNGLDVMACATIDGNSNSCTHEDNCSGPVLWLRVRDAVTQAMDSTTLADLVPSSRRAMPLVVAETA